MLEPTSGSVTVDGLDHRMHIQDVRKNLGFCPQYGKKTSNRERESETGLLFVLDILYNELSVEEHLDLMGKVGMIEKRH
jgi:ABC-type multidrug transport system ATPase subunit